MKEQGIRRMQSTLNNILSFKGSTQLRGNTDPLVNSEKCLYPNRNEVSDSIVINNESPITDEMLKTLINLSTDLISVLTPEGTIIYESDSIKAMLGYEKNELIGVNAFKFIHKDDIKRVFEDFKKGLNNPGTSIICSYRYKKSDGNYIYLESTGTNFEETLGNNFVIISRDITSRIESEKKIHKLTAAVEQSSNTVLITDINGKIEYVNKKFADLTGYDKDEAIGASPSLLNSGKTSNEVYKDLWTTILTGKVWQGELWNKRKSGELYWESIKITPVVDENDNITNFIAIKDDITSEKLLNEKLAQNLNEKEIMLKEIHHRVKNNLQIVISLLNLQSTSVDDVKLKSQLTISQNRVRSMALIHQLLYRSKDLSMIDMEDYLLSLSSQLLASYAEIKESVNIKVNASDVFFTIETAVPFGLLINELISNSLKHGFPDRRKGNIEITLTQLENDRFELNYFDDGIGIHLNVINGHVLSFGMNLIEMLVSQLEGNVELIPDNGTNYKINFRGSNYQTRFK